MKCNRVKNWTASQNLNQLSIQSALVEILKKSAVTTENRWF